MQEIRSSNVLAVTGICDPNNSRARHNRSLKLDSKLKYLNFKNWETLKNDYHLDNKLYFQWIQLIHANPLIWKQTNKKKNDSEKNVETNYVVQDHHLIKSTRVIALDKLIAREKYSVLLLSSDNSPTSQIYFGKVFPNENLISRKFHTKTFATN